VIVVVREVGIVEQVIEVPGLAADDVGWMKRVTALDLAASNGELAGQKPAGSPP
jgi:hypothetical protein